MKIDQTDLAHLSDEECKAIALAAHCAANAGPDGSLADFWRAFSRSMSRAIKERRRIVLDMADAVDDGAESGSLVEPGSDPVGDARRALRQPPAWL